VKRLAAALFGLCLIATSAIGFYQSRDSNYNISIASSGGYTGPVDVNGTAFIFWSTRCGSTSYTGNVVDIWDTATGITTETLVTCSAGGVLNTSSPTALATTCAVSCSAKTIYDQSGGNKCTGAVPCNLVLGTGSTLPTVNTSFQNGKIGITFVNTNTNCMMSPALASTQAQPFTVSFTGKTTSSAASDNTFLENSSNGNNMNAQLDASGGNVDWYAGLTATATASANNLHAIQLLYNSSTSSAYVDGTSTTGQNAFTLGFVAQAIDVGAKKNGGGTDCAQSFWEGEFLEIGIWASDKTANNSTINSNQHSYWAF
jgi:hypothetical protein